MCLLRFRTDLIDVLEDLKLAIDGIDGNVPEFSVWRSSKDCLFAQVSRAVTSRTWFMWGALFELTKFTGFATARLKPASKTTAVVRILKKCKIDVRVLTMGLRL